MPWKEEPKVDYNTTVYKTCRVKSGHLVSQFAGFYPDKTTRKGIELVYSATEPTYAPPDSAGIFTYGLFYVAKSYNIPAGYSGYLIVLKVHPIGRKTGEPGLNPWGYNYEGILPFGIAGVYEVKQGRIINTIIEMP